MYSSGSLCRLRTIGKLTTMQLFDNYIKSTTQIKNCVVQILMKVTYESNMQGTLYVIVLESHHCDMATELEVFVGVAHNRLPTLY